MNILPSLRIFSFCLLSGLVMLPQAIACPDCALKDSGGIIEPQTVTAKLAFSASTLMLMGFVFLVLGFLIWSMIKACQDLGIAPSFKKSEKTA